MKSNSERLSHPETSNGRASEGNCVVVRWDLLYPTMIRLGGDQGVPEPLSKGRVKKQK
jgi:hypothetical protein